MDEGRHRIDALHDATTFGEVCAPMSGTAASVEDGSLDLIGPGFDEVPVGVVHGVHRPEQ